MPDRAMLTLRYASDDIFLKLIPRLAAEAIRSSGLSSRLSGGEYRVAVDWFGRSFSYTLKSGGELVAAEGATVAPALRISMNDGEKVKITLDERVLFGTVMPGAIMEVIVLSGRDRELAGTEFTLVMEVSGSRYSYRVKDGKDISAGSDDIDAPMMRVILDRGELERMISIDNIDILFASRAFLSRARYDALKLLKGTLVTKIAAGGTESTITLVLNGGAEPFAEFGFSADDFRAVMSGAKDPVSLFMGGAMKIKGDMGFAMAVRPLFVQS
ncbi:MAG TPA: SCP2 sterol-binding domain-containing protein [Spirochaetota bacterium]|nr:SCP2 sterol-binding domain-containing protein [Spirochaetota bacterium]